MATTSYITLQDPNERHPIYCQYYGEYHPQGGQIVVDLSDGEISARDNPELGNAISMNEWHGHILTFSVSPYLSGAALNEIMESIQPLAQEILDGYESVWDGRNHVARLTDDAQLAYQSLQGQLDVDWTDVDPCDSECDVCWPDESPKEETE